MLVGTSQWIETLASLCTRTFEICRAQRKAFSNPTNDPGEVMWHFAVRDFLCFRYRRGNRSRLERLPRPLEDISLREGECPSAIQQSKTVCLFLENDKIYLLGDCVLCALLENLTVQTLTSWGFSLQWNRKKNFNKASCASKITFTWGRNLSWTICYWEKARAKHAMFDVLFSLWQRASQLSCQSCKTRITSLQAGITWIARTLVPERTKFG